MSIQDIHLKFLAKIHINLNPIYPMFYPSVNRAEVYDNALDIVSECRI